MTKGFFSSVEVLSAAPTLTIPRCGACGLFRGCKSPKMKPTGDGRRRVLVVAEAPGQDEDDQGTQLVGRSGKLLRRVLGKIGVDLDRDCWKTNAVVCHPGRDKEGRQRKPTDMQVLCCRPNLMKTIDRLRPDTIVLLGAVAVKSLIGTLWREDIGKIGRWVGWKIPSLELNAWVCPTWHPSYVGREENPVLDLWFRRHLRAAFGLEGQPHPGVPPDYAGNARVEYQPGMVADFVGSWIDEYGGDPVAIDYETTALKPDADGSEIVCCSLAWEAADGIRAVAYPWVGEAIAATGELLRSKVPMIAHNMKFEDRWTRRAFGHGVRNWRWDTMQAAHVLDNRPGITSLKFQAFVRLGLGDYGQSVVPYLKAGGSNVPNRIREADLGEVLKYNGMDALVTYELARLQMEEMGNGS